MFRERAGHLQQSVFDGANLFPETVRKRLHESWATTFNRDVFCRLDESLFADLYSEEASRPNAPVNVLRGMDILKSGRGWSDRELIQQVQFNMQVRYGLGVSDWGEARAYFCGVVLGVFHRIRRWIVTELVHRRIWFRKTGPYSKTVGLGS